MTKEDKKTFFERFRKWFMGILLLAVTSLLGAYFEHLEPFVETGLKHYAKVDEQLDRIEKRQIEIMKQDSIRYSNQDWINKNVASAIDVNNRKVDNVSESYASLQDLVISVEDRLNKKSFINDDGR